MRLIDKWQERLRLALAPVLGDADPDSRAAYAAGIVAVPLLGAVTVGAPLAVGAAAGWKAGAATLAGILALETLGAAIAVRAAGAEDEEAGEEV